MSMPPIPMGERVAVLERAAADGCEDLKELKKGLAEALDRMARIEQALCQRHGAEKLAAYLIDFVKMAVVALMGAGAAHWFSSGGGSH